MKACADGKTIEFSERGENRWIERSWDDSRKFDWIHYDYRIKPEPTYRPFKDKEECWNEMQKHQPFGWIKNCTDFIYIANVDNAGIEFIINEDTDRLSYISTITRFKFADGTPFGVKEE